MFHTVKVWLIDKAELLLSQNDKYSVSVVLNVYKKDEPHLFEEALRSVLDQSYPAKEVLIVQNGPVPQTISKVLKKYSKNSPLVSILEMSETLPRGLARHKGILATKNRYIALMDADDLSCRNRFKVQIKSNQLCLWDA